MKKLLITCLITILGPLSFSSQHRDGTYRGNFFDSGENQVTVQFELKNDVITSARYRHLSYKGKNFLKDESLTLIKEQYNEVLKYIIGKNIKEVTDEMYDGSKIEKAGATVRVTKVRSAVKDGILHDVYSPAKIKK
ncbi:MAG: hypothetical protein ACRC6K_08530 [Fusobacteriaceae bacterium]